MHIFLFHWRISNLIFGAVKKTYLAIFKVDTLQLVCLTKILDGTTGVFSPHVIGLAGICTNRTNLLSYWTGGKQLNALLQNM